MAVAAHVSRVAKDYAPYGYSIIEDVVVRLPGISLSGGAGNDNEVWALYVCADADAYVEGISWVFDTATAAGATWNAQVVNETAGVSLSSAGAITTHGKAEWAVVTLPADQNQVIAKNAVLTIIINEVGTAVTALPASVVVLRIRRKA